MNETSIDTRVSPNGQLAVLSKAEVNKLLDTSQGGSYQLLHKCSLAVLNCGNHSDDGREMLAKYPDFSIKVIQEERGIKLEVQGAPGVAFVDGKIIKGIKEHLFAVLRDIVYVNNEINENPRYSVHSSESITDAVFHILRNANIIRPHTDPNLVVCWGGHSIVREEYEYCKEVGYEFGLRGLNICTGCGPGAMKGPMKGAAVGHVKQRINDGRYIGITEPGIIAAESPNPIVSELVILPDIEKRLEAFVRVGHGIVVFPGGAGTTEEILYLLGILLHPDNADLPFPLVFTGPRSAEAYFKQVNQFIGDTLGLEAQQKYQIIIDDPAKVAREIQQGISKVKQFRIDRADAFNFNWLLKITPDLQQPFIPSHKNMAGLALHKQQDCHHLAANLRKVFSGIVAGNVKEEGINAIEKHGHFEIKGDKEIMLPVDDLLKAFVSQGRMKLPGKHYQPCYRIVT